MFTAIPCPEPPCITNGYLVNVTMEQNSNTERHNATYNCDTGYTLSGDETVQCVRGVDEQIGHWPRMEDFPTCNREL